MLNPMHSVFMPNRLQPAGAFLLLALDSAAFVLAAIGCVHLMLVALLDFNLLSEALRAGPVAVASMETVLALAGVYVVGMALNRKA
jgi:hypothetical protein